jgi:hypothetical protein
MTFDVKIRQLAVNDVLALIGHSVRSHAPKPISKVLQEVALKYKVSSSALRQWTELFINMGHVDVTPDAKKERKRTRAITQESYAIASGRALTLDHLEYFKRLLWSNPGLSNLELSLCIFIAYNELFPPNEIQNAIHKEHWTSKVMEHYAREMNIPLVEFFKSEMHQLHAHWFLYADGTPFNPDVFDRKVGRSPRNVKAVQTKLLSRLPELSGEPQGCSVFVAISIEGTMSVSCEELVTKESMQETIRQEILPIMNEFPGPRSVLVLDNAPIYDKIYIVSLLATIGAKVVFLPAYCPRLNPDENCHHIAKDFIRKKYGGFFLPYIVLAKEAYYTAITPQIAINIFENIGHVVLDWEKEWALR